MLGRTIGNYEVVSQFGEGGMGELYLGRHTRLAREVIIKTIRTEDFSPRQIEHLRDRLEREAFVQSQLDHSNIVRVYDFIASGDTTCIVMEYVPGRDLRRMISRETGPVPYQRAIKLFKQILAAINYAHHFVYADKSGEKHMGIIHRDLKPANILVTPNDIVKVTDFGIVKVRGVKGGTQMGFNPGTPEYMSPEQARGRELDQRSDIYSLGIMFYEMLTGHVPFEDDGSGTSDYEIRRGHIEMPVPPLSKFYPGISHELEKIVFKALEKNPDDRYQTAQQFLDVIEDFEETGTAKITGRMPGARNTVVAAHRGAERQKVAEAPTVSVSDTIITDANPSSTGLNSLPLNNTPSKPSRYEGVLFARAKQRPIENDRAAATKSRKPLIVGAAIVALISVAIVYWLIIKLGNTVNSGDQPSVPVGMISIPSGELKIGRDDGNDYEKPSHSVFVKTFLIDATEVTNEQYQQFIDSARRQPPLHWRNGHYPDGEASLPVVNVSWDDANAYARWAGKRLPTEEEWEYAARGTDGRLYPYGNRWKPQYSNALEDKHGAARNVRSYPDGASPFGVFDMAGNVLEWTASDFKLYPGSQLPPDDPNEGRKVLRGGAFNAEARFQTATDRFFYPPPTKSDFIGFRCAKDAPLNPEQR
ncbi:MAG: SUMF1/EgtB/PvdO family nonheme iron enzyme [Blastocatellia bacterium]